MADALLQRRAPACRPGAASAAAGQRRRRPLRCSASASSPPSTLVQQARVMAFVGSAWSRSDVGQQHIAQDVRRRASEGGWMAAGVLPFAAMVSSAASTTAEIYGALAKAIDIYLLVLTLRVILTWFRNINWMSEPFATLRQFTDPFLSVFRGILPTFGGIDLSVMIGFFGLKMIRTHLVHLSRTMV